MEEGDELLDVVDREGRVIGHARRSELHGDPSMLHRVVHVLVFNKSGDLLLQKRSMNKDVAPGRWDTSVGGHVHPGEGISDAALRELKEELGISECRLTFLYQYIFSNHVESELVSTFFCCHDGEIAFNRVEIDEVSFRDLASIREDIGKNVFSAHFEEEIQTYLSRG